MASSEGQKRGGGKIGSDIESIQSANREIAGWQAVLLGMSGRRQGRQ